LLFKIFLFLIGFGLLTVGFSSIILYINLLGFGYTLKEYINYLLKSPEFYYLIFGFILLNISIFIKGEKNEKHIWYIS